MASLIGAMFARQGGGTTAGPSASMRTWLIRNRPLPSGSMRTSPRAAIYLRVSKADGSQSVENQRPEVEQLARARGFDVVRVYEEQASAAKHCPEHERMMRDARRG